MVVDALAAGSADRLCRVIQVTDAGIVPRLRAWATAGCLFCRNPWRAGGGRRCAHGDGCPAAGGAGAPHGDASGVDARVRRLSSLISAGINAALFPDWSYDEIAQFVDL